MNKYEITKKIEDFAPLELQEKWDCSGWLVETQKQEISKVMLALTVTEDVIKQARKQNCDMIISHHPLFYIPLTWKDIDIYCAHTNLDKAEGGTTDILVKTIFNRTKQEQKFCHPELNSGSENFCESFIRYVDTQISIQDFITKLKTISPNLRYVNNHGVETLNRIAFCAGSGSEFIQEAFENSANAFVTGDLKFHTALESPIVVFDIGHFESEIIALPIFERVIGESVDIFYAKETSPFKQTC